ncbi:MAG: Rne/Rng family ribonuclease [Candidatus Nanopelagicales bacterium]
MVDNDDSPRDPADSTAADVAVAKRTRRRAASRPAGPPVAPAAAGATASPEAEAPAKKPAKKATTRKPAKKAAAGHDGPAAEAQGADGPAAETAEPSKPAKRARASKKATADASSARGTAADAGDGSPARMATAGFVAPLFVAPEPVAPADADEAPVAAKRSRRKAAPAVAAPEPAEAPDHDGADADEDEGGDGSRRRRRRRGGRGRKRRPDEDGPADESADESREAGSHGAGDEADEDDAAGKRRRRRRRRGADGELEPLSDDAPATTSRSRQPRERGSDDVTGLRGSTRLEAKKQRRREGREAGRRRAPILTEAEFLARREAVERVMAVRQKGDRTQIAVLEDGVLVEHYVTRGSSSSMVGNVYLGRVQNVLPSMEAAFVDIGRGRNAVLYAGEVNWDAAGLEGQPKRIELAMKSGDPVLVQVTKDPVGQKGARLTSQVSLPGRFLVYVPDGSMTGISRKLPDTERSRLKAVLKRVMPENAGVIVRTAAEGAPEDALEQDVARLAATWAEIEAATKGANPPTLLYSEPDLAIKVVRDIFNEDVTRLVVAGDAAWAEVSGYIGAVAPDLVDRLQHWVAPSDLFAEYRVDEQLLKALDRKVYLPSGGSLVIDRTEAMTVVDVNTGKFTGQGGNLEQTVTRNNIEAAEEIVRQLRLRDIGGIIVVDFIDMVLESNRDLVLRRLVECLGRDRTKHQVAEVTSLGLVQMTRKRIGSGLLESFSETCDHCNGRGIKVSLHADDHEHSPRYRKPANAVDPADVAARALLAQEAAAMDDALDGAPEPLEGGDVTDVTLAEALDQARESALDDVREELFEEMLDDAAPEAIARTLVEAEALEGAV